MFGKARQGILPQPSSRPAVLLPFRRRPHSSNTANFPIHIFIPLAQILRLVATLTLTLTRKRLPPAVFAEVFEFVLRIAQEKRLLSGQTVGVDSTLLEADAAMKTCGVTTNAAARR